MEQDNKYDVYIDDELEYEDIDASSEDEALEIAQELFFDDDDDLTAHTFKVVKKSKIFQTKPLAPFKAIINFLLLLAPERNHTPMKKPRLIAIAIFAVTFLLPFRYAVLDVDSAEHGFSVFGVFFTAVGFLSGFYFLVKDDQETEHGGEHSSH